MKVQWDPQRRWSSVQFFNRLLKYWVERKRAGARISHCGVSCLSFIKSMNYGSRCVINVVISQQLWNMSALGLGSLSVSSLSRRKYLLDQGYLNKRNKELNTRLHQFPYLWVRTGQTEWPLKLPHESDKRYRKYIFGKKCVLEICWPRDDLTVAGWVEVAMRKIAPRSRGDF